MVFVRSGKTFSRLVAAAAFCAGLATNAAIAQIDIKVGAIQPLSGPAATFGQSFTNVVPLAVEALKKQGVNMTVVAEDGAANVPSSIAAYNKLVRVDNVPAIIHSVSPVVLTLGPMGERDKIVLINSMAGAPEIGKLGAFTFSTMPSYQIEGTDAAKFAYAKGARKVVGIYLDTATGKAAWDVFKPAFIALGGQVVGEEAYPAGTTEFRAQLTRAASANPDWVYLSAYAAEPGRILSQAGRMGLTGKIKFLGIVGAAQPETIEIGGSGAEGFIHANWPFDPEAGTAKMKEFGKAYMEKHKSLPTVYAATSYDALIAIGMAAKAGAKTGAEIQNYLEKKMGKTEGVTGEWSFDDEGMVVLVTRFVEVKDGKRVPVK